MAGARQASGLPTMQSGLTSHKCTSLPMVVVSKKPGVSSPTALQASSTSTSTTTSTRISFSNRQPIVAVNVPAPERAPVEPPRPLPVMHSSVYLQQSRPSKTQATDEAPSTQASNTAIVRSGASQGLPSQEDSDFEGSAVEWFLKKADRSLDELEHNPMPIQKAIYDFSSGPVGQVTGKGVEAAARLTVRATVEAAKAAAPVGKWALQEGTKAAVGLIKYAMVQSAKQDKQKKGGK